MLPITLRSPSDTKIAATSTATNLFDLIDTANSEGSRKYYNDQFANALIISPEDGDIRYLEGDDPTATEGILISEGTKEYIPGITLDQIQLIRAGSSDVAVTVVPYRSEPGESPGAIAYDVSLETGEIEIGRVQIEGLGGASTDGSETLTGANTWVQVPGTVPTDDYTLVVSKESEAGTIRWSFDNGGTPGSTNGNKFVNDDIIFNLKGSQAVYFGSTDASDVVNWTAKVND